MPPTPPAPIVDGLLPAGNRAVSSFLRDATALEHAADEVALEHAAPLAQDHGWLGRSGGLGTGYAKRAVGARLGADLTDVPMHPGRLPGAPSAALASVLDGEVYAPPGGFPADTAVGQALLAHELTHVVQQSTGARLPAGPGAAHTDRVPADHGRRAGAAPAGMAQHTISCSPSTGKAPPAPMSFDEVKTAYHDSADPAVQAAALAQGIATARANAARLFRSAGQAPISTLKARYEAETGEKVSANPLIGVTQDDVEHAYRAWAENPAAAEAPWVLLAVWVKEGIGAPTPEKREPAGIPATSAADARSIYRSLAYYWNFGTDVFIAHTAATGADNAADFSAGTGAAHDTAFQAQIARQVSSGRLIRDVSGEIDAALSVAPAASPGLFTVTASPRFPELSLMLVDAFYREQRDELVRDPRVGANPDPGLTYMRWNMRASTFDDFLNRAPNPDPDGTTPTRETWAFHRPITPAEYGQPRENAMRFKYLIEVFQHAYQDKS